MSLWTAYACGLACGLVIAVFALLITGPPRRP